jgi:hypothetical protein
LQDLKPVHVRNVAVLVTLSCLPVAVACGGKSAAEKAREAAAQSKAACDIFVGFHPPEGDDLTTRINATKASYGAFLKSADLAGKAAALDPKWKPLQAAAEREAAGFEVLAKASDGTVQVDRKGIGDAVKTTNQARVVFLTECAKADPEHFTAPTAPAKD